MKRAFLFAILITFIFFSSSCNEKKEDHTSEKKEEASCTSDGRMVNPNGDSELALLMRMMYESSLRVKGQVEKGALTDSFPSKFLTIHTATPTDSTVKGEVFTALASKYIEQLQILYKTRDKDLSKEYDNMVSRCLDCHNTFCPGPIKKINKLRLPLE